jgi:alpha-amylase
VSRLSFLRPFALAALVGGLPLSCMDLGPERKPELSAHVADWRDEIIYQVLVDRFANGDSANDTNVRLDAPARYHGGDWRGLEGRLDYIEALGVTTLWISPVVKNVETDAGFDGYHGYWAQDLTAPNPHFGDIGDLRHLVYAAHARGIKVIVDIVTNHMGQLFYYDINQNGQPDISLAESGAGAKPPGNPVEPKPVTHVTEYDPDFDPRGIQSRTSLGEAGPAPIVFVYDPAANKLPALPAIFQEARAYHRRGRIVDYDATVRRCENDTSRGCSCGDPGTTTPDCGDCAEGAACFDYFEQTQTGDFPGGLKDVATELPEVRAAMIDVYATWIEQTDIDGYRIDTLKHVEHEFWRSFVPGVRARVATTGKSNFFVFGESFDGNDQRCGTYTQPGELDGVFYFSQKYQVFDDIFKKRPPAPTAKAKALWDDRPKNYGVVPQDNGTSLPPTKTLVNFLDNHDVARFLFDQPDPRALHAALTLLLTEDGIPCIYYGTEQRFSGGNDPANREDMWGSGYDTTGETFRYTARLTRLRRGYPALKYGDQRVVWSTQHTGSEVDAGMLALERTGGDAKDQYALVVINSNPAQPSRTTDPDLIDPVDPTLPPGATMQLSVPAGTVLVDVLNGGTPYTVGADGTLDLQLEPLSSAVLVPQSQVRAGI